MGLFIALSTAVGALCVLAVLLFGHFLQKRPSLATALPREKTVAAVMGLLCLIWSDYHACIMLEGDLSRFHMAVHVLVPVTAVLGYIYLDFLFARTLGGLLILCANRLIYDGFVQAVPCRPLYSVICLVLGVFGLFALGTPWRLRQLLQHSVKDRRWSWGMAGLFALFAAVLILLPPFSAGVS